MILGATALMLMLLAPQPAAASGQQLAQITIRHHIIMRMTRPSLPIPGTRPAEWREGRGPRCIEADQIVGAARMGPRRVDLVMRDNRLIRAVLENSCPALDYYYGFYVSQTEDGRICADRDAIRSRMGGECGIERFRSLQPVRGD